MSFQSVVFIFFLVIAISSVVIGVIYLNIYKKAKISEDYETTQKYAREHLDVLGVHNWGTSMDERDIYVVSSSELGFRGTK